MREYELHDKGDKEPAGRGFGWGDSQAPFCGDG